METVTYKIKRNNSRKKKLFIMIVAVMAVIVIGSLIKNNKSETGNTNGNLNNSGFSVEKNGWVYYVGLKDNNTDGIYRIKSNRNKREKVSSDYGLYLNKAGKFLYYLDVTNGQYNITKIRTNGKDKEIIIEDVDEVKITVVDNWIYYFKESNFYRVKIDGKQKEILSKKTIANYEIVGNWIYYSYVNDGKYVIEKMKTNGEDATKLDSDASQVFFVDNTNIYYIYENYNTDEFKYNYEIYKIKTNGKNKEKVAYIGPNVQLESINFNNDKIYYTKTNENDVLAIYSIKTNGKKESKIVEIQGESTLINIHDGFIYYTDINDIGDSQMYRIKLNGKNKQSL